MNILAPLPILPESVISDYWYRLSVQLPTSLNNDLRTLRGIGKYTSRRSWQKIHQGWPSRSVAERASVPTPIPRPSPPPFQNLSFRPLYPSHIPLTSLLPERKVSCDRALPACTPCTRSNRPCKGYALRLSWPRNTDRKRAILGPTPPPHAQAQQDRRIRHIHGIHVTSRDIEVYRSLMAGALGQPGGIPVYPALSAFPARITVREKDLFHYCKTYIP